MPKKDPYSIGVAASPKKQAAKNPVGSVEFGTNPPPNVPAKTGVIHGLGPHPEAFKTRHPKGVHGFGHLPKQKVGTLRLSGYANAHRLGAEKGKKPGFVAPKTGGAK
jgi:hypothetical protein